MINKISHKIVQNAPHFLKIPLKMTPFKLQKYLLEQLLAWQFKDELEDGELDFLQQKWLEINVIDLHYTFYITLENNSLHISQQQTPNVSFSAEVNDLVLIAARKEDPDTLFFQRRLRIEGDTELGLYIKNLMDSIDLDLMPKFIRQNLDLLANTIKTSQTKSI